MALLDQPGEKAATLIRKEIGESSFKPGAVTLRGDDDNARLGHEISIRAGLILPSAQFTESFFLVPDGGSI